MPTVKVNELDYAYRQAGAGQPFVLLHGFTGSHESWWPVLDQLAESAHVTAFDLPGHGETSSPQDPTPYAFASVVDDLARAARLIGIERAAWLGYSLGGRVALGLTVRHPDLVSALILESASPGICSPEERQGRLSRDNELAERIERLGIPTFVAEWEALPLWNSQRRLSPEVRSTQRQIRLRNSEIELANALRGLGQGAQPSLWPRLSEIWLPVLLLAGELDPKYVDIAAKMAKSLPDAELALVPDAGHTIHLEAPSAFCDLVYGFLAARGMVSSGSTMEMDE